MFVNECLFYGFVRKSFTTFDFVMAYFEMAIETRESGFCISPILNSRHHMLLCVKEHMEKLDTPTLLTAF